MRRTLVSGLAAVAALSGASAMASPSTVAVGKAGHQPCKASSSASARVMEGTSKWRDPNTLTARQVRNLEARTTNFLDRHNISPTARPMGSVKIKVHFHIITKKDKTGGVSNKRIRQQMRVLNNGFAGRTSAKAADTPFRFRLASVERVRNGNWYYMNAKDSREAKRALRVGDARDLNIYVTHFGGNLKGLLGFATFPEDYKKYPRLDGVVVLNESLPGGNAEYTTSDGHTLSYNRGDTATHEVGHWMNLYHTFQGSCGPKNDYVSDTPPQRAGENIFWCKPNQNTCGPKGSRGDPTENFMNYVDDPCMNMFTRGQRDRMNISWYIRQQLSH